jgi:hypothetical protein
MGALPLSLRVLEGQGGAFYRLRTNPGLRNYAEGRATLELYGTERPSEPPSLPTQGYLNVSHTYNVKFGYRSNSASAAGPGRTCNVVGHNRSVKKTT